MTKAFDDFLDAYAKAEKELRKRANARIGESLSGVIRDLAKRDKMVRRYEQDLLVFHKLRNVIVHERRDGQPIADPLPSAVKAFTRIAEILTTPPRIERFVGPLQTVGPDAAISEAAQSMSDSGYSQLPVVDNDKMIGLFTAETIARWYAANVENGKVDDGTVREAMTHTEDNRHMRVIAKTTTVDEVIAGFEDSMASGYTVDAMIVTHSGKSTEKPLGIITAFDLPELHAAL